MKIKLNRPLIWPLVRVFFPGAKWGQVVVTWGDTVYTPGAIGDDLKAHEAVHTIQQKNSKLYGLYWWARYIFSPKFRIEQEIPAHQMQYEVICKVFKDRNRRERVRRQLALFLSSKIYNNMLTFDEAYKLLK